MKNLFTAKFSITTLSLLLTSLLSAPAFAHSGHLPNEAVHGFLHVEHIIAFVVLGLVAYVVFKRNN